MSRTRTFSLFAALALFAASNANAAAAAGDGQAKKITKGALEKEYAAKDYRGAVKKLGQAATTCETKGCSPAVHGQIYASLAAVHWTGTEDYDSAAEALRTMVRLDPGHKLERRFATPELSAALETARQDVRTEATAAAAEPEAPAQAEAKVEEPQDPEEENLDPKEREFRRQVAARKAAHAREADETRVRLEAEAARVAVEQKKEEAARKAEEARKARDEKREAAKRAAEQKAEAARLAAEQKKAEAARNVLAAQTAALEKKEADRKAIEDKKAEDVRKAEEARQAAEDARLRTPFKAGKFDENVWKQQVVGYPLPVFVKLPPPPAGVERERAEVAKVVTEYYGPATPVPEKIELKPLGNGGYGALLPCEATSQEGVLTYFTIALNKYDNLVALGGSPVKPHKVKVKASIDGNAPHLPGEGAPKSCAETATTTPPPVTCNADTDCPDGGVCAAKACATPAPAAPMPGPRGWRACKCELAAPANDVPWTAVIALLAASARLLRSRARRGASRDPL